MEIEDFQIIPYTDSLRDQLIHVWERSVLATHSFLKITDFKSIKKLVKSMNFNEFDVFCLMQNQTLVGFIGIFNHKIEMLFLSPDYIRKKLGMKLLKFAINELKADKVDVNEQNLNAVSFYQKFGFTVFERSELDDQGNPYPILRMKRDELTRII